MQMMHHSALRACGEWSESTAPTASRPVQTFLTLIAFGASAFFLGTDLGDPEVISVIGWTTALIGAISTVDLLLHRCFATSR